MEAETPQSSATTGQAFIFILGHSRYGKEGKAFHEQDRLVSILQRNSFVSFESVSKKASYVILSSNILSSRKFLINFDIQ